VRHVLEGSVFSGRYRVLRPLGAGAMGTVYEVLDLDTDRRRALKVMHARSGHAIGDDERWKREAKIAGKLDSRFIVDVYDVGIDAATGTRFLVMELLQGEDLSRRLRRLGQLPASEVVQCLHHAALALDRMHRAGIVHRDLKPGNLFRDERDGDAPRYKIVDLGVAIESSSGTAATIAGTPLYMAPEQFRNGVQISAATDVFALGMLAFTLLAGRPYWIDEWEVCGDKIRFALIAVRGPVEPASRRAARHGAVLPAAFDTWFDRATAVDPARRFSTAGTAAQSLAQVFDIELAVEMPPAPATGAGAAIERLDPAAAAPDPQSGHDSTITAAQVISNATQDPPAPHDAWRVRQPRQSRPRFTWRHRLVAVTAVVLTGILLAGEPAQQPGPQRVHSPLASSASVLGCPVLEVAVLDAHDDHPGWLGAAAAALLCERARLVLGGATSRTHNPAELLGLPREPTDDFPVDPYSASDARLRSRDAARQLDAYIDGKVASDSAGFQIAISLHDATARLAGAEGRGTSLLEAVRTAMQPLVDQGLLPWAEALDPAVREFSRARDPAAALALFDVSTAMILNAGGLAAECARIASLGDRIGEMATSETLRCAYSLGQPRPDVKPLPAGSSPGAIAVRARIARIDDHKDDPALAHTLTELYKAERSAFGRSVLAATASCLLQGSDEQAAVDMARFAVRADPKNPAGENCAPWLQLATIMHTTTSATSAVRAMQAWAPWDSYGWLYGARGVPESGTAIVYARRAYALSPLDTEIAAEYADQLLVRGQREEVRQLALSLAAGGYPVHRVASEMLLLRVDASEALFRKAVDRARSAMMISSADSGWVRKERFDIALRALEISDVLGGSAPAEMAELIIERFIDPEPSPLPGGHFDVPLAIPAICSRAPAKVAARCFARFRILRDRLTGGILPTTTDFVSGAEHYARGDLAGAARAWRPLLKEPEMFAKVMFEPMAITFELTGQPELVDRLAAAIPDRSDELHGASLAVVHAARRAARRGEHDRARALARRVVDAWSVADELPAVIDEMRRLASSPS
jgi:hypothetical protein